MPHAEVPKLDEARIARRKEFLRFGADDIANLTSINDLATAHSDSFIEQFYEHLLSFPETREFFRDPAVLERVKRMQKQYFVELTQGHYEEAYVENRLRVGIIHERISLPQEYYLGMFSFYIQNTAARIFEALQDDRDRAIAVCMSLIKLIFFDVSLATDAYLLARERTIQAQQEAIRELSTPVLQLRPGLLILPIVGVIDSLRARQITEQLLRSIRTNRARAVVLDVTGVPTVDTQVANHLVQTVEASRLMGAQVIVTGLSPEVAQTLVILGVDLGKMRTLGDLQSGVEEADRLMAQRERGLRTPPERAAQHDPRPGAG